MHILRIWGNDLPAPKGEDCDEDVFLSLTIVNGSRVVVVEYGSWKLKLFQFV